MNPFTPKSNENRQTPEIRRLSHTASEVFLNTTRPTMYHAAANLQQRVRELYPDMFVPQPAPNLGAMALETDQPAKPLENGYQQKAPWPEPQTAEEIARSLVREAFPDNDREQADV